jgi:hypothetical protein
VMNVLMKYTLKLFIWRILWRTNTATKA